MRVELEFDKKKLAAMGYTFEQVAAMLENACKKRNLGFVSDAASFTYYATGLKNDYSNVWIIISGLCNSSWFLQAASACRFFPSDDNAYEDVLSQAHLLVRNNA